MGGLVKSDICYVKIALFGVKIVLFHSHIFIMPLQALFVSVRMNNHVPTPFLEGTSKTRLGGEQWRRTESLSRVSPQGTVGLSTRHGELAASRQCGFTCRSLMRRHSAVPCGETRAARDCVTETSSNMT